MLKIKKTNKYKKIVSIIFILITLLSTMQPIIFAVSSSGTGQWVSGQWILKFLQQKIIQV